jgi:uncharacterized membrane protein
MPRRPVHTSHRRHTRRHEDENGLKFLMIALAIAYPITAHRAVMGRSVAVTAASLAVLASLFLLPRLVARSIVAWCLLPAVAGALLWLAHSHAAWLPLYATPVFVNIFGAWIFGHTLAPGQVPLIERIARLLHEEDGINEGIARYARKVTIAWTLFLSGLAVLNATLALLASPDGVLMILGFHPVVTVPVEVWSLFANFIDYVMAGVFFIAEYAWRQRKFPEQPYRNLFDFINRARRVGHRVLGEFKP